MKINHVLVNWSLFDEELLEPYEWKEDDDIELIQTIDLFFVSKKCLSDFINNIIQIKEVKQWPHEFIIANESSALAIELDMNGHVKYRSVLTYDKRTEIQEHIDSLDKTTLSYEIKEYCEIKEYGLTRNERVKKQFMMQKLELLYKYQPKKLLSIFNQMQNKNEKDPEFAYKRLLMQLQHGYLASHEYLYKLLYLI